MAAFRIPGPLGCHATPVNSEDGTMCRQVSPQPGSSDAKRKKERKTPSVTVPQVNFTPTRSVLTRKKPPTPTVLRERSQGEKVRKLQQLLNSRVTPRPDLAADGIFGPLTREAVVTFQRSQKIAPDGIVGPQTWYFLHKTEPAKSQAPAINLVQVPTTTAAVAQPASAPAAKRAIWEWSLKEKLLAVIERVLVDLFDARQRCKSRSNRRLPLAKIWPDKPPDMLFPELMGYHEYRRRNNAQ